MEKWWKIFGGTLLVKNSWWKIFSGKIFGTMRGDQLTGGVDLTVGDELTGGEELTGRGLDF